MQALLALCHLHVVPVWPSRLVSLSSSSLFYLPTGAGPTCSACLTGQLSPGYGQRSVQHSCSVQLGCQAWCSKDTCTVQRFRYMQHEPLCCPACLLYAYIQHESLCCPACLLYAYMQHESLCCPACLLYVYMQHEPLCCPACLLYAYIQHESLCCPACLLYAYMQHESLCCPACLLYAYIQHESLLCMPGVGNTHTYTCNSQSGSSSVRTVRIQCNSRS